MTRETQGHNRYFNLYWEFSHRHLLLLTLAWRARVCMCADAQFSPWIVNCVSSLSLMASGAGSAGCQLVFALADLTCRQKVLHSRRTCRTRLTHAGCLFVTTSSWTLFQWDKIPVIPHSIAALGKSKKKQTKQNCSYVGYQQEMMQRMQN